MQSHWRPYLILHDSSSGIGLGLCSSLKSEWPLNGGHDVWFIKHLYPTMGFTSVEPYAYYMISLICTFICTSYWWLCGISSVSAMEIWQSCINSSCLGTTGMCHYNTVQYIYIYMYKGITYIMATAAPEHKSDSEPTKNTPYFTVMGMLWDVYCEDFSWTWPYYKWHGTVFSWSPAFVVRKINCKGFVSHICSTWQMMRAVFHDETYMPRWVINIFITLITQQLWKLYPVCNIS